MCMFEMISWSCISYHELQTILQLHTSCDVSVNIILQNKLTPLCMACKYNREDLVTILLHHGADANISSQFLKKSPLHFACAHDSGNVGVVRKLIDADADIDAVDEDGNTALHLACFEENIASVKLLLESSAKVDLQDIDGETPLMRACMAHNIELIDLLLNAGSDPNLCNGQALGFAIRSQADKDKAISAIRLLIDKGADIHQGPFLLYACQQDDVEMMKVLHHYGANVEKSSILGVTPLQTASFNYPRSLTPMQLLLEWGALVNARSQSSQTALHYACITHDLNKISLLLSYGADVNVRDMGFNSPLLTTIKFSPQLEPKTWPKVILPIVSILLAAGTVVTAACLVKLRSALVELDPACKETQQVMTELFNQAAQPKSLQFLCRINIRANISPDIDQKLETLPLPVSIVRFLKFSDILKRDESV